jgi:hypothetical protein
MAISRSGWVVFASIVIATAGVQRIFDAIWAFRYDGAVPDDLQGAIFGRSLTTYGWVWLAVAAVYFLGAWLVLDGSNVGRWFGIVVAAIGAVSAIWWMPYYPVWSLTYVGLGGLVIYALAVHGGQRETAAHAHLSAPERPVGPQTPVVGPQSPLGPPTSVR